MGDDEFWEMMLWCPTRRVARGSLRRRAGRDGVAWGLVEGMLVGLP